MEQALKEYTLGERPALYIADKYSIDIMELHRAYAKLAANGTA